MKRGLWVGMLLAVWAAVAWGQAPGPVPGVRSVNGRTGVVTLEAADVGALRWETLQDALTRAATEAAAGQVAAARAMWLAVGGGAADFDVATAALLAVERNPDAWTAGWDTSAISPWNSFKRGQLGLTAIAPRAAVGAAHDVIANGQTAVWYAADGSQVERAIEASVTIGATDVRLYLLDAALPAGVRPARLPGASWTARSMAGVRGFSTTQAQLAGLFEFSSHTAAATVAGELSVTLGDGDSGKGAFAFLPGGELGLVLTWFNGSGGPSYGAALDGINTQLGVWGLDAVVGFEALEFLGDAVTERARLGLGTAAVRDVGTAAGDVAAGDRPAAAVSAHEGAFSHALIGTALQRDPVENPSGVQLTLRVENESIVVSGAGTAVVNGVYEKAEGSDWANVLDSNVRIEKEAELVTIWIDFSEAVTGYSASYVGAFPGWSALVWSEVDGDAPAPTTEEISPGETTRLRGDRIETPALVVGGVAIVGPTLTSVTADANVTWTAVANGDALRLVLEDDLTLTMGSPDPAERALTVTVEVVQDDVGGHTLTWAGAVSGPGGIAPLAMTGADEVTVTVWSWTGARWRLVSAGYDYGDLP